ncbi:MAG: hypothetical protein PF503_25325 [Desulfobacula sp.]|jgi:hypothetical protein|nr:hypothetical protein [Desulfobacula sp.]
MMDTMNNLIRFGFSFEKGGAHLARTMMLKDLTILLEYVNNPQTSKIEYVKAIQEDNCLGKKSGQTRKISTRHLKDLYSLDPDITLFKSMLFFWNRDLDSRPLLALLCTIARDAVFRISIPFIQSFSPGQKVDKRALEEHIEKKHPERFSKATLESIAQNINSTWTQSGHLNGRVKKVRSLVQPSAGAVSYAIFLGYLSGFRGESLFHTDYAKMLDCPAKKLIELAEEASRKGWIVFKRIGNVMEVLFPSLLTTEEMEWIHEQN